MMDFFKSSFAWIRKKLYFKNSEKKVQIEFFYDDEPIIYDVINILFWPFPSLSHCLFLNKPIISKVKTEVWILNVKTVEVKVAIKDHRYISWGFNLFRVFRIAH